MSDIDCLVFTNDWCITDEDSLRFGPEKKEARWASTDQRVLRNSQSKNKYTSFKHRYKRYQGSKTGALLKN